MITLNKKNFAANDKEFTDSLLVKGETCVGYYKVNTRTITLLNAQKEKIGCITSRLLLKATKVENGYFYNSATIPEIGEYDDWNEVPRIAIRFDIK